LRQGAHGSVRARGAHPIFFCGKPVPSPCMQRFFYFFIFFRFLQKYIFDLEIYRNIPRPPHCRAAGTWPPGSGAAGAFLKKKSRRKLRVGPWGPVARQRGGRPWPPGCGATGRNFCNLSLFAKEFHICALFVTFGRNRPWGSAP